MVATTSKNGRSQITRAKVLLLLTLAASGGIAAFCGLDSEDPVRGSTPTSEETGAAWQPEPAQDGARTHIERVLRQLSSEASVTLALPSGTTIEGFETLGRLNGEEERTLKQEMINALDTLAGHMTEVQARYQFQQIVAEIDLLESGRYWVLPNRMDESMRIAFRLQAAVPGLQCVFWPLEAASDAGVRPGDRTVVFPLVRDEWPGLSGATRELIAAIRLPRLVVRYNAMEDAARRQVIGPLGVREFPFVVPEGGMKTRLGDLPAGTRIDSNLRISLPHQ